MRMYFIHDGTKQEGPYSLDELKTKNITRQTPIWFEGIDEWTIAENIEELKSIFTSVPPPFTKVISPVNIKEDSTKQEKGIKPKKKKGKIYLYTFIISLVVFLIFVAIYAINNNNSKGNSRFSDASSETYEEKKMTVEEIERSQPTKFLSAEGSFNENFWGDKIKVHGIVINSATVATYKDAVVEVTYYSKTMTDLGSNQYTIYENFPPNSKTNFELKIDNFKNVNSIGLEVVDATAN